MTADTIGLSIIIIGVSLVVAKLIRIRFAIFSKYFLPSSVIAGLVLLLLGPEVLGNVFTRFERTENLSFGIFTEDILSVLSTIPGLLISVIFAGLFLGKRIPNIKKIWRIAGPQASFGQTIAWGQYAFGLLITIVFLTPVFGISPMAGALIEIGFQGGHGTSAGLADTFAELGFAEGADLALGLATVGVVSGVIIGVFLINWGVRKNKTNYLKNPEDMNESDMRGIVGIEDRQAAGMMTTTPQSIAPLALHFGMIAIAILLGQGILTLLVTLEQNTWGSSGFQLFAYVPLFPLAMIGGVILQILLDRYDKHNLVDRDMIGRIQGFALDFLIVAAIASLSLQVIGDNIFVFITLALVGIVWNVTAFLILARRIIPKNWFERGIGDLGQSMGMTAAGLMLIRIVDSEGDTQALEAFGYKQLLFEPVVGGGIMTAISVPLIYQFGAIPMLIFTTSVMLIWLCVGLFYFGRKENKETNK